MRDLSDVSERGLAILSRSISNRWIERWPAFSLSLTQAIANEYGVRQARIHERTGFEVPQMPIDELPPLLSSLCGYLNATLDQSSKLFITLVIADLVRAAEPAA